jgi:hypothetical protein
MTDLKMDKNSGGMTGLLTANFPRNKKSCAQQHTGSKKASDDAIENSRLLEDVRPTPQLCGIEDEG